MPVSENAFLQAASEELTKLNDIGTTGEVWDCLKLAGHFDIESGAGADVSRKEVGRVCEALGIPNQSAQGLGNRVYNAAVKLG